MQQPNKMLQVLPHFSFAQGWGREMSFDKAQAGGAGAGSAIKLSTCYCSCSDNLLSNKQQGEAKNHINLTSWNTHTHCKNLQREQES